VTAADTSAVVFEKRSKSKCPCDASRNGRDCWRSSVVNDPPVTNSASPRHAADCSPVGSSGGSGTAARGNHSFRRFTRLSPDRPDFFPWNPLNPT
jgi:hypothetical protein